MARRVALILPSSTYRAHDFVAAAKAADAELVIATEPGQVLTDPARLVEIDLDRPEWSAQQLITQGPFDAVIPVDDGGVTIGALAAEALGLPHSAPGAVAATRDKALMRDRFGHHGVPQPEFRVVHTDAEAAEAASQIGYPVVVKPTSLAASQGVIRVDDPTTLAPTLERIRRIAARMGSTTDQLLVEGFVPGPEVALEAMLAEGKLVPLALLDKPDPLDGPYFEETMFVTPSRHSGELQTAVIAAVERATNALGLAEGPVHAEVRLGNGEVRVLEVAARPIGGLCSRALEFGMLGASLETVLVRHALRLPQAGLDQAAPSSGVFMIPIPIRGRLRGVSGLEEARSTGGITGIDITVPPGELIRPLPEGNRYLGFIFARAMTPGEVESALRRAHSRLSIEVSED